MFHQKLNLDLSILSRISYHRVFITIFSKAFSHGMLAFLFIRKGFFVFINVEFHGSDPLVLGGR